MGFLDKLKFGKKSPTDPKRQQAEASMKQPTVAEKPAVQKKEKADTRPEPGKEKKTADAKSKVSKTDTGEAYRVLKYPMISEKSSSLGMYNQYVFRVAPSTNKIEVKKAVEKVYGVTPVRVNIMRGSGKVVRYGRTTGRTRAWKKAVITLAAGQKIQIQEGL